VVGPDDTPLSVAEIKKALPGISDGPLNIGLADDLRNAKCEFTPIAVNQVGDCFLVEISGAANSRGSALLPDDNSHRAHDTSLDWTWETDAEHRYTFYEEKSGKVTKFVRTDVIGLTRSTVFGQILPDFEKSRIEKWTEHYKDMDARRPFRGLRYALQDSEGNVRYRRSSGSPVFDSTGEFQGYQGNVVDVTPEVEAEQKDLAHYRHFAEAVQAIKDGIGLYDAERKLIVCNDMYRYGFGSEISPYVVPGVLLDTLVEIDVRSGVFGDIQGEKAIAEAVRWQLDSVYDAGSSREYQSTNGNWIRSTKRPVEGGGFVSVLSDITEARTREKELERSEERYRDVFDKSIQGIVLHRDMVPIICNQSCADIFGYETPDEIIELGNFSGLLPPHENARLGNIARSRVAGGPAPRALEHQGIRKDGVKIWLENRSSLVKWEGEAAIQVSLVDITERKESEAKLHAAIREAEGANRAKSEFLANMSHELRTPLNAVIGFAEMMERGYVGDVNDRQSSYLGDIVRSGNHLLGLINDVLDLSKVEAGQFELNENFVSIPDIVEECLHLLSESAVQAGLELDREVQDGLPRFWADERIVKQMLLNLLSNAVKFTPIGGSVKLIASLDSEGGLDMTVHDTGIGMAPGDIPKALSVFGQVESTMERRFDGTGLGLPLVHSLIEMHGGQLYLRSELGIGTTATIWMPGERGEIAIQSAHAHKSI